MRRASLIALVMAASLTAGAAGAQVGAGGLAERPRVAFVTYAGARNDRGLGQAFYEGFLGAVARLRLEGRVFEVAPIRDPKPTLMTAARQRYDLVIDDAPVDPSSLAGAAAAFPKVKFLVSDFLHADFGAAAENVQTFVFRVEEAGYLAGYLAGLLEKRRPDKDVIGAVGGEPYYPQVVPFIAGYRAGARKANPRITTLIDYSHDFAGPAKCRAIALSQISRGAGVVFNVAGGCGLGVLDAAKATHVWGVGVDTDQSFLGPHVLTSVVKRPDVAYYSELKRLKDGKFRTGGTTFLGLKQNGVGLGRISPEVPRAFVKQVERIRADIVAGRIHVPSRIS